MPSGNLKIHNLVHMYAWCYMPNPKLKLNQYSVTFQITISVRMNIGLWRTKVCFFGKFCDSVKLKGQEKMLGSFLVLQTRKLKYGVSVMSHMVCLVYQ